MSLQIGVPVVLSRSTPRLWSAAVVEIWGTQNETKNDAQQNVCTSLRLAGSYSPPQATMAREIEGGSWRGARRCRVRQPAVVGSQKRLTGCFREFELASQQQQNKKKLYRNRWNISIHAREPNTNGTSSMKKSFSPKAPYSPGGWYYSLCCLA